jgi:hypothetical protein
MMTPHKLKTSFMTSGYHFSLSVSESYVTTDGLWASLRWNKAPIWGLRPDFYYCQTGEGLLMWGALSDDRTDLSFTIAAGPRQRSHCRVRVPWGSPPYFTVSDLRLPFSSPPMTCRTTSPSDFCVTKSKSKLLYDWRFTANQFVLASSPLSLTTSIPPPKLNPCDISPYVTSSLTRRWVCLL